MRGGRSAARVARLATFTVCVAIVAGCGSSRQPPNTLRIVPVSSTPAAASAGAAAGATPTPLTLAASTTPVPSISVSGTYRIAATAAGAATVQRILSQIASTPKFKLSLATYPDAAAVAKSGADLALVTRLPGQPAPDGASVVQRRPIALALPFTLTPDDLTLAQAVGLLTGGVTDWSQVGGAARAVHLAESDPSQLSAVGGLVGTPGAQLAPARTADAEALIAETDAGAGELAVLPWNGPWLKSKALRIDGLFPDDPGYPLAIETDLAPLQKDGGSKSPSEAAPQVAALFAAELAPSRAGTVLLDGMGDFMLARGVQQQVQQHGLDWPFAQVKSRLDSADIRYGNLEFALTDRGAAANKDYTFRAPPSAAQSLAQAGINIVDLANNHVLDYGAQGLLDTESTLDSVGVAHVGAGADLDAAQRPLITTVNGVRIAWLAYANVPDDAGASHFVARSLEAGANRPGVAWGTPEIVAKDVAAAKQQAEVVIVALHSGYEYTDTPNSVQRDLAHAAIDAGAALVLGAHPHVLQGIEFYKGGVIAYSLGNFVFDLDNSDRQHYGLPSVLTVVLRIALDAHGVTGLQVYPAIINSTTFQPEPVSGADARPVFSRLENLTTALNPPAR